ncbi:MAG: hypothetical protein WCC94_09665, partial [Candidatus Bathyarchaeia archaeon]
LCTVRCVNQRELLPEGKTLTRLVAELDESYRRAGEAVYQVLNQTNLVSTLERLAESKIMELKVAEVVHGKTRVSPGHSLTRFGGDALVACRTEDRALMKHDRLVYAGASGRSILLRDRGTGDVYKIPKSVIVPALRRFAYINRYDLTGKEDLAIAKPFSRIDELFHDIYGARSVKMLSAVRTEWARVVKSGSSRLCVQGRVNLAAPGTMLIAVRSKRPILMCSFMWGISNLSTINEKVILIWLNSAVFFYLLLSRHTATQGSWVKLHKKSLMKIQMLDPTKLSKKAKARLVKQYSGLSHYEWPSILNQYSSPSQQRKNLDREVLNVLGIEGEEAEGVLGLLYGAITTALRIMQRAMAAD